MTKKGEFRSLLDGIDRATSCLKAMAVLVENTMRSGEDVNYISNGVEMLISGQTDVLQRTSDALMEEADRIRAEKFELGNLDEIAAMFGVQRELVEHIVSAAVGVRRAHLERSMAGVDNAAA